MDAYRGTEGTRPYAGAGWYYAEYRQRVSLDAIGEIWLTLRDEALIGLR